MIRRGLFLPLAGSSGRLPYTNTFPFVMPNAADLRIHGPTTTFMSYGQTFDEVLLVRRYSSVTNPTAPIWKWRHHSPIASTPEWRDAG